MEETTTTPAIEIRPDDVLEGILKIAQAEKGSEAARLRAWEMLGKHIGMFRDGPARGAPVVRATPSLDPDASWDTRWDAYAERQEAQAGQSAEASDAD